MPVRRHPIAVPGRDARIRLFPVDAALATRLRASYVRLRAHDLRLAEIFYARLFTRAPHLRAMFPQDLDAQAAKLVHALDAVVANLERPEANAEMLAALGRRHAAYGARAEHYALVTDLLVDSIAELESVPVSSPPAAPITPAATATSPPAPPGTARPGRRTAILEEWRTALDLISAHMLAAAST